MIARISVEETSWLLMQHISNIWCYFVVVAIIAHTSYFVCISFFNRKPLNRFQICNYGQ